MILAHFSVLHSDILPLLLVAFESAYKDSLHKGTQQLQTIANVLLPLGQVRTQIFTKLLSHEDILVRSFAINRLQKHTDLDDVGLHLFWSILREEPSYVAWISDFLKKNIRLICEDPVAELMRLLQSALRKYQSGIVDFRKFFDLILMFEEEVKERSPTLEESLLKAIKSDISDLYDLGRETSRKSRLRPETIEKLFQLCEEGNHSALRALQTRVEAIPKAQELLQSTTDQNSALRMVEIIASVYVPLPISETVTSYLTRYGLTQRIIALQAFGNDLCAEKNVTLRNIRAYIRDFDPYLTWWRLLSLREFCQNINSFDETEIDGIFPKLFMNEYYSTHEQDTDYCVWIKGDKVYQESVNGISEYPLEKPDLFRRAFRKAQESYHIPKWQWIGVGS